MRDRSQNRVLLITGLVILLLVVLVLLPAVVMAPMMGWGAGWPGMMGGYGPGWSGAGWGWVMVIL